jgi:amidase
MRDYALHDATAIAEQVTRGDVAPGEVLDACLAAIEARNPALNAVIEIAADAAREQVRAGLPGGPLHGVPILLKDLGSPCRGTRTTAGSALFADVPLWTYDNVFVARLKAAGAVIVGRTNSCEFGISLITEPAAYGPTQNPHRAGCSPGGSSGGSAAAVASGMVPLAHATDGCGSIRVPAAHCGIFGLKPSRGRVSFAPDAGESWAGMSNLGGLTRTVRDTALLLDVVSGAHPGDPYAIAPPARPYRDELALPLGRLRIALMTAAPQGAPVDPRCAAAANDAAELCRSLGHEVVPLDVAFDVDEAIGHMTAIWSAQLWTLVTARYAALGLPPDGRFMEPVSWALAQTARRLTAHDYACAVQFLHRTGRDFARALAGVDVLLTPVTATVGVPLGALRTDGDDVAAYMRQLFALNPFTAQFNLTGAPAMSVPLGWTADGLPIGCQFAAAPGDEALLLRLAGELEAARPWLGRAPSAAAPTSGDRRCP